MNTYIPLPNSSAGSPVQFSEPAAYSYESCHCCPRNCQINRTKNRAGVTALPRYPGGTRGASSVGGTVYQRSARKRYHLFFRLHAALLFLPELPDQQRRLWKRYFRNAPGGNFSGTAGTGRSIISILVTPTQYLPSLLPVLKRVKPQLSIPDRLQLRRL